MYCSWSGIAYRHLYLVVSQLYRVPYSGVAMVPVQVIIHIKADVQHRLLWFKVCLGTETFLIVGCSLVFDLVAG